MSTWSNILTVARREFLVRVRGRSFVLGTLLLVIGVVAIAYLPLIIRQIDQVDGTKIAVAAEEEGLAAEAAVTISAALNASTVATTGASDDASPDYIVTAVDDLDAARAEVVDGARSAVLYLDRAADGDLRFTLYTNDNAAGRVPTMIRQAASAVAVGDRLDRHNVPVADRAALFAPAVLEVQWPDPGRTDPTQDFQAGIGQDMLGFGMTLLIFMIIVMYGNWVAMSVVEEKSSRVMEVILNAATPFQLLAGKVLGVGAVAFTQYAAIVAAGLVSLLLTDTVTSAVAGSGAATDLPTGLTPWMLLAFAAYGVLGFLLYASLYAAAGSLVSRQEDVNAVVMPMTLVSVAGYMVGVYSATGLIDGRAAWVVSLAFIPFTSPFTMLGRIASSDATPVEVVGSLVLLVAMIGAALWVAARIYSMGVLMYGTRPGWRAMLKLLREGM
jgi:ABC-2 type transport system permease protein